MSFSIFTDPIANLDSKFIAENDITVVPMPYRIGEKEFHCLDIDAFDEVEYYNSLKSGTIVTTSQINPQIFSENFEKKLKEGKDILLISFSSGISGSYASACIARDELSEKYPDNKIIIIDSLAASLGEGLAVIKAAELRNKGMSIEELEAELKVYCKRMYQVFIVDNLMHLRRTGRLSNISAVVGAVLGIKPLLKGNSEGKIVAFEKIRGKKQAIDAMAKKYALHAAKGELIGISHCNAKEDAEYLIGLIKEITPEADIKFVKHEPVSGSHIGPGSIALFFESDEDDVRDK